MILLASREDTTVAAVSKEPMNETESPEAAQCHSYCVANLDYYKSLKAIPADNVTQSETEEKKIVVSVEPPSNGTNESELFESATHLCVMTNALCVLLCRCYSPSR
jgi:hypothetical protein